MNRKGFGVALILAAFAFALGIDAQVALAALSPSTDLTEKVSTDVTVPSGEVVTEKSCPTSATGPTGIDKLDQLCPATDSTHIYVQGTDYEATIECQNKKLVNYYGKPCGATVGQSNNVKGICVGPSSCCAKSYTDSLGGTRTFKTCSEAPSFFGTVASGGDNPPMNPVTPISNPTPTPKPPDSGSTPTTPTPSPGSPLTPGSGPGGTPQMNPVTPISSPAPSGPSSASQISNIANGGGAGATSPSPSYGASAPSAPAGSPPFSGNPGLGSVSTLTPGSGGAGARPGGYGGYYGPSVTGPSTFGGSVAPQYLPQSASQPAPSVNFFTPFVSFFASLAPAFGQSASNVIASLANTPQPIAPAEQTSRGNSQSNAQQTKTIVIHGGVPQQATSTYVSPPSFDGNAAGIDPSAMAQQIIALLNAGAYTATPFIGNPDTNTIATPGLPRSVAEQELPINVPVPADEQIQQPVSVSAENPYAYQNSEPENNAAPPSQSDTGTQQYAQGGTGGLPSTYTAPRSVSVASEVVIGVPSLLSITSMVTDLSGGWAAISSSLENDEAALAQVESNYDEIRAQIEELQQEKIAGICNDACNASLSTLELDLPASRAVVDELNAKIDREVVITSSQDFAAALPVANFASSNPAPAESTSVDVGTEVPQNEDVMPAPIVQGSAPADASAQDTVAVSEEHGGSSSAFAPALQTQSAVDSSASPIAAEVALPAYLQGGAPSVNVEYQTPTPVFVFDDPWVFASH